MPKSWSHEAITKEPQIHRPDPLIKCYKVKDGVKYPAAMLTHGINDPRVDPWMSVKMAARLQAATASGKPVLLRIDYDAGHGIGSSKQQNDEVFADIFAFLFQQLGGLPGNP
jgi:prolyl oligopeptidase